jgi:hypothetical protein
MAAVRPRGRADGPQAQGSAKSPSGGSLAQIVKELSVYLIGWRGYFGFCETPSVLRNLDQWTRRRLRVPMPP